MFCTLCYLSLDLRTGRATCANAGHHPVLRSGRGGVEEVAEASGPPIGILPDGPWTDFEFRLDAGDSIYMYTDGITEARGATKRQGLGEELEEYGLNAVKVLAQDHLGETPEVAVRKLLLDVHRFCEPLAPHDDCTLMVLRYLG